MKRFIILLLMIPVVLGAQDRLNIVVNAVGQINLKNSDL
jgi:hypothetical protein